MKSILSFFAVVVLAFTASAQNSPYATNFTGVPLDQMFNDIINGVIPTTSEPASQGQLSSLTDATSASEPTGDVVIGPDSQDQVAITWDLGALDAELRRLQSVSIWIANDEDRSGFTGSLSTSLDGIVFNEIPGSSHTADFPFTPNFFHNVLYNFSGLEVSNFRYVRLNSAGYVFPTPPGNPAFQPRFVEVDMTTTAVPEPGTVALLAGGGAVLASLLRKKKRA